MKKFFVIGFLFLCTFSAYSQEGPVVTASPAPRYPPTAIAVGASGEVEVLIAIDSDGEVISATAFSGHPLLKQTSREAAMNWRFEKEPKLAGSRSLIIVFSFGSGEVKIIEKSERETEEVGRSEFAPPYRLNIKLDTLIPKLLLLPREKGVIKAKTCELHDEEMDVEIQDIVRNKDENDSDDYGENYADAMQESFPNAQERYYGYHLSEETKKVEVHYCKTCRLKREQWILEHKFDH